MGITCRKFVGLTISVLALSACDESGSFNLAQRLNVRSDDRAATDAGTTTGRTVEQDVEVPEVFSVTAEGLWDGRPSLGGVWVAHPDVDEPERVIIRNPQNGQSVVGALFRREREMPGPQLQISSDAAVALAMVAGAPQELSVTALQRKEVPVDAAAPDESGAVTQPATVTATTLDPIDVATAAIEDAPDANSAALDTATRQNAAAAPGDLAPTSGEALAEPYLQVGEFSLKWNANRTLHKLRRAGMTAELREDQLDDRTHWRVIVGPTAGMEERAVLLDKVRAEGFDDAYPVTN